MDVSEIKGKRWEYVLAFSFFFGFLGVDRFITGRWVLGLFKLFTIRYWNLVSDRFNTYRYREFKDGDGNYILRFGKKL